MATGVTVIIPTLGTRPFELDRAIASVAAQDGVEAKPLIVVNGQRYDRGLVSSLERTPGLRLHTTPVPGVSHARLEGRRLVDTPYFAFLDDDDEFLPDALRQRLETQVETGADVVVTNGYREASGERRIIFPNFDQCADDPAMALLQENWLASAGGLYRADTIGEEVLRDLPDHLEMTYLAFWLAHHRVVVRLNLPTFVIHSGATEQASASWGYCREVPDILRRMEGVTSRKELLRQLKRRRAAALHLASVTALDHRKLAAAWGYHLKSLTLGSGLRYLPYTRHIVLGRRQP